MVDDPKPPNAIGNISPLVLLAAITSVLMGVTLLAFSESVKGLLWYGVGITLGGLALFGFWYHWRRRGDANHPFGAYPTGTKPPGLWFPIALFSIVLIQVVWLIYTKNR